MNKMIYGMLAALALVGVMSCTMISAGAEKAEVSVVHCDINSDTIQTQADLLKGKAEGEAYIGSNSNRGTGVYVQGTASGCAASAETSTTVGNQDAAVTFKGETNVGKVGANAGIGASVHDGKLNVGINAGVEATAVEAKVSGSASAGGVEVGGTVGVKVGVGATGKVGINDGKFSAEISVAAGLGITVSVDVDISGMADTAAKGIEKSMPEPTQLPFMGAPVTNFDNLF